MLVNEILNSFQTCIHLRCVVAEGLSSYIFLNHIFAAAGTSTPDLTWTAGKYRSWFSVCHIQVCLSFETDIQKSATIHFLAYINLFGMYSQYFQYVEFRTCYLLVSTEKKGSYKIYSTFLIIKEQCLIFLPLLKAWRFSVNCLLRLI